jgi:hypothetical protein
MLKVFDSLIRWLETKFLTFTYKKIQFNENNLFSVSYKISDVIFFLRLFSDIGYSLLKW